MAGPWFTVQESGTTWQTIDTFWISNGREHEKVRLEIRTQLEEYDDER